MGVMSKVLPLTVELFHLPCVDSKDKHNERIYIIKHEEAIYCLMLNYMNLVIFAQRTEKSKSWNS